MTPPPNKVILAPPPPSPPLLQLYFKCTFMKVILCITEHIK